MLRESSISLVVIKITIKKKTDIQECELCNKKYAGNNIDYMAGINEISYNY